MPTVPTYHLALFVCLCYLTLVIAVRNVPPESDDIDLAVIDHAVICKPPIPPLASLNDCTRAVQLMMDTPVVLGPGAAFRYGECLILLDRMWRYRHPSKPSSPPSFHKAPPPWLRMPQPIDSPFHRTMMQQVRVQAWRVLRKCRPQLGHTGFEYSRRRKDAPTISMVRFISAPEDMPKYAGCGRIVIGSEPFHLYEASGPSSPSKPSSSLGSLLDSSLSPQPPSTRLPSLPAGGWIDDPARANSHWEWNPEGVPPRGIPTCEMHLAIHPGSVGVPLQGYRRCFEEHMRLLRAGDAV